MCLFELRPVVTEGAEAQKGGWIARTEMIDPKVGLYHSKYQCPNDGGRALDCIWHQVKKFPHL